MRSFRCLCLVVLLVPFTLAAVGCGGSSDSGPMASDDELKDYGAKAAEGTAFEGLNATVSGEAKSE